jgi:adenine deaminase
MDREREADAGTGAPQGCIRRISPAERGRLRAAALGKEPADRLFTNCIAFNPFTCGWEESPIAVKDGIIVGLGEYRAREVTDLGGRRVVPGLIDAHVHIESSLLLPREFARLAAAHGTTTVIADPHEIANTCGAAGISWMLRAREGLPVDILFMLPSCVPATPLDPGGAILHGEDLLPFLGLEGVLGLGEMMNVPGVLSGDPEVWEKLSLTPIIDGHAPLLAGRELNAYVLAGMLSDHECTTVHEALEKLMRGMHLFLREGSTERNIATLCGVVSTANACRCSFATDDRHADMLVRDGHIDDCIRSAVSSGIEIETAIRMATLSPAEFFLLHDRGAISPGRRADFCVLGKEEQFTVELTCSRGVIFAGDRLSPAPPLPLYRFRETLPGMGNLGISGSGTARVVGLVPGQILTEERRLEIEAGNVPDLSRDILKCVVCSRYHEAGCGIGLVQGFGLKYGAIAASISHDSHNIVSVGVSDREILSAISEVVRYRGAMAAVSPDRTTVLPLPCAGLMSDRPGVEVAAVLDALSAHTGEMGGIRDPFMYLSFIALTVIPALRVTERGPFDAAHFSDTTLFLS